MVDEMDIEPDFYIDKADPAVFVPDDAGHDKATYLNDRTDPDLFDYELEVEPILQVLVGKSLEHARIEVIEEYEAVELEKMRVVYKKQREAMLLKTQQMEAHFERQNEEKFQRNRQQEIRDTMMVQEARRSLSKTFAQQFLKHIKKDAL
jgi:hypothetical protein